MADRRACEPVDGDRGRRQADGRRDSRPHHLVAIGNGLTVDIDAALVPVGMIVRERGLRQIRVHDVLHAPRVGVASPVWRELLTDGAAMRPRAIPRARDNIGAGTF